MAILTLNTKYTRGVVNAIGGVLNTVTNYTAPDITNTTTPLVTLTPTEARYVKAWGTTLAGQTPAAPVLATGNAGLVDISAVLLTFQAFTSGTTMGVQNAAASPQMTVPAGRFVHYIGILKGSTTGSLLAYVKLTNPDTNYNYTEIGTLTVPASSYKIMFPL